MWTASYPLWQQCRLMCPHLLEVCCTAGKPPHGETCTKYSTIARGMPHESCIQSDEMRDTHTHQYLHRYTCTQTLPVLTKNTPSHTSPPPHPPHDCTLLSSDCDSMCTPDQQAQSRQGQDRPSCRYPSDGTDSSDGQVSEEERLDRLLSPGCASGVPERQLNRSCYSTTSCTCVAGQPKNKQTNEEESKQFLNGWVRALPVISASQWDFNHRVFLQSLYTYMQYTYFTNNISGLLLVYSALLRTQLHQCSVPDSELVVVRAHMYTCSVMCVHHILQDY